MPNNPRQKLPAPDILLLDIKAGMTVNEIREKYDGVKRANILDFCKRHRLPRPAYEVKQTIQAVKRGPAAQITPVRVYEPNRPKEDERRIVIRRMGAFATNSSSTPYDVFISLPRVKFIHGDFRT